MKSYPNLDKVKHPVQILSRQKTYLKCDVVILIKPDNMIINILERDKPYGGGPIQVQNYDITDIAICNQLTLIAFANMFKYHLDVKKDMYLPETMNWQDMLQLITFFTRRTHSRYLWTTPKNSCIRIWCCCKRCCSSTFRFRCNRHYSVFQKRSKFELVGALKNIKYKTYTFNDNKVMIEGNLAAHTLLGYDIIVNAVLQNQQNL